jgi:predicted SAM-dependent methyltransferase
MPLQSRLAVRYPDLLRLYRLARYELQLLSVSIGSALSPSQRSARNRYRGARGLKVQIGSGRNRVEGWVNIDGGAAADLRMDLRQPLPFADGSVALIFTEHFLDHLAYPHGVARVLGECRRVLEPGGVMRVVVHDAELLLRAYVARDVGFFRAIGALDPQSEVAPTPIAAVNHLFRFNGFHQFIYDFETLEREFLRAGFSSVARSTFRGSAHPELNLDIDLPDRAPQSLYVEATK